MKHWWQVVGKRRMGRGSFALQHLTALQGGLGAFLGLGFLNSGYSVKKTSLPILSFLDEGNSTILLGLLMEPDGL